MLQCILQSASGSQSVVRTPHRCHRVAFVLRSNCSKLSLSGPTRRLDRALRITYVTSCDNKRTEPSAHCICLSVCLSLHQLTLSFTLSTNRMSGTADRQRNGVITSSLAAVIHNRHIRLTIIARALSIGHLMPFLAS